MTISSVVYDARGTGSKLVTSRPAGTANGDFARLT